MIYISKILQFIQNDGKMRLLAALMLMSALCVGMVGARVCWTRNLGYIFLVWNLFLAWVPLFVAVGAQQWIENQPVLTTKHYLLLFCAGCVWLLFFPNAPYLITDLKHLRGGENTYLFDPLLIFSCALTGLMTGFSSLYVVQSLITRLFSKSLGWFVLLPVMGLTGWGVYIGRVLRWNSWDVFTNPLILLKSLLQHISPMMIAIVIAFTLVLLFAYLVFYTLLHFHSSQK